MDFIYFLIGGLCGIVVMAIMAASSYQKGWEDHEKYGNG